MKIQKNLLTCILCATLLATQPTMAAGIPTVDVQAVQSWIKQADQMHQNLEHLKTQIKHQVDTFNAIKNTKDLDGVVRAMDMLDKMPDEWANIYKTVENIDPTGELKKLNYNPKLSMENAMKDIKVIEGIQQQLNPNNPTGFRKRLEQAIDVLNSSDSQIAVQKATAMILAEQTKLQQAQFQYATMRDKYEADEKANRHARREKLRCFYQNGKDETKCQ